MCNLHYTFRLLEFICVLLSDNQTYASDFRSRATTLQCDHLFATTDSTMPFGSLARSLLGGITCEPEVDCAGSLAHALKMLTADMQISGHWRPQRTTCCCYCNAPQLRLTSKMSNFGGVCLRAHFRRRALSLESLT